MRRLCALLAGLLFVPAAAHADPDDLRATFGLSPPPAPTTSAGPCGDGLAFECAVATDPLADATPTALSTWLSGRYLRSLPTADRTQAAVAFYALGASRDPAGTTLGGATGLENRWTIDGAPADGIRTGGVDTRVPIAFLDGLLVTAGGFAARDRTSTGGTIDARLKRGTADHEITADAWVSLTGDGATRPIASGAYTLRRLTVNDGPETSASLVATGPIGAVLGGHAWYAAGIAPQLASTDHTWRASKVSDANHDNIPDGLPGDVVLTPIETTHERTRDYFVPAMARVGLDTGVHHLELSVIGEAERSSRFLGNATKQAAGIDQKDLIGDAIATWRATWPDTSARLQLAWHRSRHTEAAHDPAAANIPQLATAYLPDVYNEDHRLALACANDPATTVATCPVPFGFFQSGGAGQLTQSTGDRPSVTADLAHLFGRHTARIGATFEDTRLVTTASYTGHEERFSLFTDESSTRHFYVGECSDDPAARCDLATGSQLTYRTLYSAAYAEDTFASIPGLSIDGGVRWELMWVGQQLHFANQLAPRAGVAWDVIGGGQSRVWLNYARSFLMLPAGLGTTVTQRPATVDDFNLAGSLSRDHDAGAAFGVAQGAEPVVQDEITAGAELALGGSLRATLWGQGRLLRHGLETVGNQLDNPGRTTDDAAAVRETEMVAFQLEMRTTDRLAIRAGITWGRAHGTWVGPYDPRQGVTFLQGTDWDSGSLNLQGALPTDIGGRVFLEIERHGTLGAVGLAAATRFSLGSGTPRNVLGDGDGVVNLLPRGDAGRNPMQSQVDLRLAASWRGFSLTLDIFNLLNRRDPTQVDDLYTDDPVRPIDRGTLSDLTFLKAADGTPAHRRTAFQLPIAFEAPISASLGIHKAF
ncbi:MAG TPA: hypothetical protein VFP84_09595 [Kofleriaceae bacterium]|nr:hypothetical protein [Kofleriaceae bacterium]